MRQLVHMKRSKPGSGEREGGWKRGGGGDSHIKMTGLLVVSFRNQNL